MSSSRPIIGVPKRAHRVFRRTHRVCRRNKLEAQSEFSSPKQYSRNSIPLPFPKQGSTPIPWARGSARPNPKEGAPDTETPSFRRP